MVDFDQRIEFRRNEICIIGAGPAGLSAAAHCAELNIPYVLLEAADHASNTIYKYQKGKHVMAEPQILPLRSAMPFAAGKRETVLQGWNQTLESREIDIRHGQDVTAVTGEDGRFEVKTRAGETFQCSKLILAIGLQGNLRMLGVPGEA